MTFVNYIKNIKKLGQLTIFRLLNSTKKRFACPVCKYNGPFRDVGPATGLRKHAKCPNCNALERHRNQYLVMQIVLNEYKTADMAMLHFAPETLLRNYLSKQFHIYETADLNMPDVDHRVDLQNLPFRNSLYDFVFASHVLEHIPDDIKAIKEICRILKPGGIAILPVPVVAEKTIEYPEPNPSESHHVRAPGLDYFDRFEPFFSKIEQYSSESLPEKYQPYIFEDRSKWPTAECPLRPAQKGERHGDIVPVCYV